MDNVSTKISCVAEEHPVATTVAFGLIGIVAALPLCFLAYRYAGKTAGKAAAKELKKAGVHLGYTHD